jgi:hypothetical protein
MEIGCNIMTHEREEAHDSVSGVAFADKLTVDSLSIEDI